MRLITFNTLFMGDARPRLRALAGWLEQGDLDVACLQEVFVRRNLKLLRRLTPSFRHEAWTPMGPFVRGGLLTISRHPIERCASAVFKRRGRLTTRAAADRFIRKGMQVMTISVNERRLTLINTHLLANYANDWSRGGDYAGQQADELAELAAAARQADAQLPLIVVGDLNVPGRTWLFDGFLNESSLRDARAHDPRPTYRPSADAPPTQELDHVLYRPPVDGFLEVDTRLVLDQRFSLAGGRLAYLSDHVGIEAQVRSPGA
jgi:endonuclease/exonuclease/phosphatase family metal-dependent hydrolase